MQFADPAWEPHNTQGSGQEESLPPLQQAETPVAGSALGATQQADQTEHEYAQGYQAQTAYTPGQGETFQQGPQQQQYFYQPQQPWYKRLPIWAWLLIFIVVFGGVGRPAFEASGPFGALWSLVVTAFLVFVAWLFITRRVSVSLGGEKQPAETRTFEVNTLPTVVINNRAGSIRLRSGQESHQVSITTTKRGYLFSPQWNRDAQISYNQDSAANTVSARVDSWKPFGKNAIDFDIVVPPQANLRLTTNAGNISVQNVAGQIELKADAGSISATQVELQARSRLKTDAGSIAFAGSLDPLGNYELTTDLGSINVSLPADASFSLDAGTDLGSVSTNLPLVQQRTKVSGQVGVGPYPRLKVKTDLGSVSVYRR
jgi:hypothetical protein